METILDEQQAWVDNQMQGGNDLGGTSEPRAEATANDAPIQAETSKKEYPAYVPPVQIDEQLAEMEKIIGYLYTEIWDEPDR